MLQGSFAIRARWVGLVALWVGLGGEVHAQLRPVWSKFIGTVTEDEVTHETIRLSTTRFVSVGTTASLSGSSYNAYLLFTDKDGNTINALVLPDQAGFIAIAPAGGGDFYVLGRAPDTVRANSVVDLLWRFDSTGTVIRWVRGFNARGYAASNSTRLLPHPNGVIAIAGRFAPVQGAPSSYRGQLVRYDAAGRQVWDRRFGRFTSAFAATPLVDGSYILVCSDPNRLPGIHNRYSYDHWLVKVTPQGDSLTSAYLRQPAGTAPTYEQASGVWATTDGGLVVAGFETEAPFSTPMRGVLIKLDAQRQEQWRFTLIPAQGNNDSGGKIYDVQELVNGHFLVSGQRLGGYVAEIAPPSPGGTTGVQVWEWIPDRAAETMLCDGDAAGTVRLFGSRSHTVGPFTSFDAFLTKADSLQTPLAHVNYCATPPTMLLAPTHGVLNSATMDFALDSAATLPGPQYAEISLVTWDFGDGTPADTGWTVSHTFPSPQPVRVRVCATNNLFCQVCRDLYPLGTSAELLAPVVRVFPNPAVDGRFTVAGAVGAALTITDALGQVVGRQAKVEAEARVELGERPAGVYALRLTWPDGRASVKRLVR